MRKLLLPSCSVVTPAGTETPCAPRNDRIASALSGGEPYDIQAILEPGLRRRDQLNVLRVGLHRSGCLKPFQSRARGSQPTRVV